LPILRFQLPDTLLFGGQRLADAGLAGLFGFGLL
jgi:hypothetical protein